MSKTIQRNQKYAIFSAKTKPTKKEEFLVNEYLQSVADLLYVNNIVHKQIGSNNFL